MKKPRKILLYSPYLDTLGGGELHILSILKIFTEEGYSADIIWDDPAILIEIEKRFSLHLRNTKVIPNFLTAKNQISRLFKTAEYEYLLYVTDGSFFFSSAKKNYIFAMYPQKSLFSESLMNAIKFRNFSIIANSGFTASFIKKWTNRPVDILYPYVRDEVFADKGVKKEKIILNVGRFFKHLHSKRQDIIIEAFKKLQKESEQFKDYSLHLVGGLKKEDEDYVSELRDIARGVSNIFFHTNVTDDVVLSFYKRAMYYWHASGYGVDTLENPHLVEHLGIAPLEAMASKCVTFCFDAGGAKETIEDSVSGFRYSTVDELISKTIDISLDENRKNTIIKKAQKFAADNFSSTEFRKRVKEYFQLI